MGILSKNQNRHPRGRAYLTSFLTTNNLGQIIIYYVVFIFISGICFAAFENFRFDHELNQAGIKDFLRTIWGNVLYLFGVKISYPTLWANNLLLNEAFLAIRAFFRTILQTLLLGSLVFKVLGHQRIFRRRKSICVSPTSQKDLSKDINFRQGSKEQTSGWELRVRFYNASKTIVEGLEITSILRAPKVSKSSASILNSRLETGKWSISLPFTPYSFRLPLSRSDLIFEDNAITLASIQGQTFDRPSPAFSSNQSKIDLSGPAFLILQISGHMAGLGRDFKESLWWDLSKPNTIKFGKEVSIDVPAGKVPMRSDGDPESWWGWSDFENVEENNYVFAYGSLLNRKSLKRTLKNAEEVEITPASLNGYSRDWEVAKSNLALEKNQRLRVREKNGKIVDFAGAIRFANIKKVRSDASVTGAMFPVSLKDLFELDMREKNYIRVDVTNLIKPYKSTDLHGAKVWAYVGTFGAHKRANAPYDKSAVIRDQYYKTIITGYTNIGKVYLDKFHRECGDNPDIENYLLPPETT